MNKRLILKEKNVYQLIQGININKMVFIDRKQNKKYRNNYKDIIYKLNKNHYKYSDYDYDNKNFRGEKVHVFGYKNLYIKIKLIDGICKIISLHVARYKL